MKLSLRWLCDHIPRVCDDLSLSDIVQLFIQHIAEVDDAYTVTICRDKLYAAGIRERSQQSIVVYIPELDQTLTLPPRNVPFPDAWYMVYMDDHEARWASLEDVGGTKDAVFPPVMLDDRAACDGSWRDQVPDQDQIIDIDNAAITHRADLWGHRSWAREIDAIRNYQSGISHLHPDHAMYADISIHSSDSAPQGSYQPQISTSGCDRFVTYYMSQIRAHPSDLTIAIRLACVDVKPHHLLVDLTNYVMYDIGQPMHAFDAQALPEQHITVRDAHDGEELQALDSTHLALTSHDMVVASGDVPLSVAGVIGGATTGIHDQTQAIVLEAAHFDPVTIRTTSARIKRRTESSMRFEKNVDPYKTNAAIERYCALLAHCCISYQAAQVAYAAGELPDQNTIDIDHAYIMRRTGLDGVVSSAEIVNIMTLLGCSITTEKATDTLWYHITVPSYRHNDLTRRQDVVEEIARSVGYDHIPFVLPHRPMYPRSLQASQRVSMIKEHCAYALSMREIISYAFYDEHWLNTLQWSPEHAVTVANPVSEHMYRLVTSLVPNMLHAVARNAHAYQELRFFEWAKVWRYLNGVQEDESLTALMYSKRGKYDFYTVKQEITSLFQLLNMSVAWQNIAADEDIPDWYDHDTTARLLYRYNGGWSELGYVGRVDAHIMSRVAEGSAYVCELSADVLRHFVAEEPAFKSLSKYQSTWFDISLGVPEHVTVAQLETSVSQADNHIHDVYLVDIYEQPSHGYARFVTLRIIAGAMEKTLDADDIEAIRQRVHAAVRDYNVQIR